jgi:hypothetical protein
MAVKYYEMPIGFEPGYYATGGSAGYDPNVYHMWGAPEGSDAYNAANSAYAPLEGRMQALQHLKQLNSTREGQNWIGEHYDEFKQIAMEAGLSEKEMDSSRFGLVDVNAIEKKIQGLQPAYDEAKAAVDTAKAGMGPDPFQAEMDRQMGMSTDFRNQAKEAQNREGVQMDRTDFDADRARELQARTGMTDTESTLRDWVAGKGPSAAQSQFQSGLDQSIASQMAMANSARGGGFAQNAARQSAGAQGALQRMQGVSQAATLRAQEMQSAMGQLQSQGYNIRAQDQTRSAQGAQWADAQSRLTDAQKARNDLMSQYYGNQAMGYEGMRQQGYAQNAQNLQAGDRARQQDIWMQRQYRQGMDKDKFDRDMLTAKLIAGIGSNVAAGAATVGAGMLGGPAGAAAAGAAMGATAPATVAASGASNFTGGGGSMQSQPSYNFDSGTF